MFSCVFMYFVHYQVKSDELISSELSSSCPGGCQFACLWVGKKSYRVPNRQGIGVIMYRPAWSRPGYCVPARRLGHIGPWVIIFRAACQLTAKRPPTAGDAGLSWDENVPFHIYAKRFFSPFCEIVMKKNLAFCKSLACTTFSRK